MTTQIVCVGNELVSDDGLGIRVGRALQRLPLPAGVEVVFAADIGLDLIDTVMSAARLVLVDATRTDQPPGTVTVLSLDAVSQLAQTPCCCHAVGLPELLRLARHLAPGNVPGEIVLVGVEAEVLDRFGTILSPAVMKALPDAVAEVLTRVGADPDLVARGRECAVALADWSPTPLEAYGG
jgi:hydrogenase maturation protease